jgi:peptide/nickel transport system substrate-binding protein
VAIPGAGVADVGARAFINNFLLFEPLVSIGWDGRLVPRLVSEWQWLNDGRALRLKLNPNVRFHDGTPLDASLLRQILTGGVLSQSAGVSYTSLKSLEVEAPDTLLFNLRRREAFLLTDLAVIAITLPSKPQVSTGPFRLLDERRKQLAAFGDYYRGRPTIDFIEVKEYKEQRSVWAALMRDDISAVHEVTPGAIDFLEAAKTTVQTFSFLRPYYLQVVFNVRHPVLGKAAVRQALSEAIDRQKVIDIGLNGRGEIAEGPIWPAHWAYAPAERAYKHNTEAATLRLDAAGYKVQPATNSDRMPSRFQFTCLTLANDARYEKIALVLQKQLYDIGVDMQVESLPAAQLVERMKSGKFDAFLFERSSGRSLARTYSAWHSGFAPKLLYSNTGYTAADEILDRLRNASGDAETRAAVSDLQRLFYEDPPAIFLAWLKVSRAVSKRFVLPDEPGRDVMGSISRWRPAESPR